VAATPLAADYRAARPRTGEGPYAGTRAWQTTDQPAGVPAPALPPTRAPRAGTAAVRAGAPRTHQKNLVPDGGLGMIRTGI